MKPLFIRFIVICGVLGAVGCGHSTQDAAQPMPNLNQATTITASFEPTHEVEGTCSLYATGPQQGSAPDAVLRTGMRIRLEMVSENENFVWVVNEEGLRGQISRGCLRPISR